MQNQYKLRAAPRRVPEEAWDDHDKLMMEKGTAMNRKAFRRKFRDPRPTKKRGFRGHRQNAHELPEFVAGTNHERHQARRKLKEESRNA